jgi:hypothetical protein
MTTLTTTNATYYTHAMNLGRISRDSDWAGTFRERMTVQLLPALTKLLLESRLGDRVVVITAEIDLDCK